MTGQNISLLVMSLVDDAGLFPPTALSMRDAVDRHRADLNAANAMLTHRFLCPASRVAELRFELTSADRFRIGLIADLGISELLAAVKEVDRDPSVCLAVVDIPLAIADAGPAEILAALPYGLPVFLEPAKMSDVALLVEHINGLTPGQQVGLKLRCGGIRPELFPTAADLASALVTAARGNVMVKATAGLHHGVRYTDDATGFTHHGFLNLVVAAAEAAAGSDAVEVADILLSTDRDTLVRTALGLSTAGAEAARGLFTSYGSCSTSTPLAEACEFGLLGCPKENLQQ